MIEFPDWYEGGFTDAEKAFYCLLKPYADLTTPQIEVTTWRQWNNDTHPVARLYRSAGASERVEDTSIIELEVFSQDRNTSIQVTEYLRQAILTYRSSGGMVYAVGDVAVSDPDFAAFIKGADDHQGPELIMTDNADARVVYSAFRICIRKDRGLPDYASIRDQIIPQG